MRIENDCKTTVTNCGLKTVVLREIVKPQFVTVVLRKLLLKPQLVTVVLRKFL